MTSPPRERPRLNLKPRDEAAAKAAAERTASGKANPFGAAKPRESILANRLGTDERSVLQEDLKKDRMNLRLKPEQIEQREAAEASISEIKTSLQGEEDPEKEKELRAELRSREEKLEEMLDNFQKLAVEQARSGEGMRPSDRRRQMEERMMAQGGPPGGPGQYGSPSGGHTFPQHYGGRGGRGPDPRGGSGGWGGAGGRHGGAPRDAPFMQGGYQGGYADPGPYGEAQSYGGYGGAPSDYGNDSFNRRGSGGRGGRDQGQRYYSGRGGGQYDANGYGSFSGGGPGRAPNDHEEYVNPYQGQDRF